MVHNKDENKGGFFAAIEYLFRIEGVSGDFTNKIYNKLIQDNLIAFNPLVASIAISLIMVIILILCYVRIIPLPSDLAFGFLVLGLSFALIPFIYSENLKKT